MNIATGRLKPGDVIIYKGEPTKVLGVEPGMFGTKLHLEGQGSPIWDSWVEWNVVQSTRL